MSGVFVDSVGLLALWNKNDQWHGVAKTSFATINDDSTPLITTTFILLECGNAAARTPFRSEANRLRKQFEEAGSLVWPTEGDWQSAWAAYQRGEADAAGIFYPISFVVVRGLGS